MKIFYEVIKFLFFILTIFVGIFSLRGDYLGIDEGTSVMIKEYLMPGYLLFCGLMIGYLVAHVWAGKLEDENKISGVYIKSFVIGIVFGVLLSVGYMFLG